MEIGKFIKQYKGKDYNNVSTSVLAKILVKNDEWFFGRKFDGNYVQIHKKGTSILMFSSGGKPFCIEEICQELLLIKYDFIIEAEFMNNCNGKTLNDRTNCSTGTARSNFQKGKVTSMPNSSIRVFDVLNFDEIDLRDEPFGYRKSGLPYFMMSNIVSSVRFIRVGLLEARELAMDLIKTGGEGGFIFNATHTIKEKGRSNLAIKLKADNQKKMICIGAESSDTVTGEWGSLYLEDSDGNKQSFGGLSNKLRRLFPDIPIGEEFNVKYENFVNGKYVQGFING